MNPLSHLSYSVLFFVLLAKVFGLNYSFFDLLLLMFFSILPDFDLLFASLFHKKKQKFSFFNLLFLIFVSTVPEIKFLSGALSEEKKLGEVPEHRRWLTHLPFVYLPLIVLFFFRQDLTLFLICFGIYSHFILDTVLEGEIMWLYPFSQKHIGLFTQGLKSCDHSSYLNYLKIYKKTIFYKLDILSFFILLLILFKSFFQ